MKKYAGWVPNVVGRLSFSIAGLSNHPSPVVFSGDLEDAGTHFIGFQRRNLSDTSIPFLSNWIFSKNLVDKIFYEKNGNLYFVCYMRHWGEDDFLAGKVLLFKPDEWREVRSQVRDSMRTVESPPNNELRLDTTLGDAIREKASAVVMFEIQRSGIIVISPEKMPSPDEAIGFSDLEQSVCSQFYFFLRDLLHKHKFHPHDTDRILDVCPEDDDWKGQVNYSLARKAIVLRRNGHSQSLHRALGVIAYLHSFRKNIMTEKEADGLDYSLVHFEESAKSEIAIALDNEQRHLIPRLHHLADKIITFILVLVGALNFLGKDSSVLGEQPPFVQALYSLMITDGLSVIVVLLLILAALRLLLLDKLRFRDKISGNLSRHAVCFKRRKYAWPELILSFTFLAFGGFLVGLAIF